MSDSALLRFLDLVRRELGADDARAEIGGRTPEDPRVVWVPLGGPWRAVALFQEPPADARLLRARLEHLAASFSGVRDGAGEDAPMLGSVPAVQRLDEELGALSERAGAIGALVIDARSPVLWGSSEPRRSGEDVMQLLHTAELDDELTELGLELTQLLLESPTAAQERVTERAARSVRARLVDQLERLREAEHRADAAGWQRHRCLCRAVSRVRRALRAEADSGSGLHLVVREQTFGCVSRSFATTYQLVLAFGGGFSELHAEGAALRALPYIERLVLALPPQDPGGGGARVLRLPVPLRSV